MSKHKKKEKLSFGNIPNEIKLNIFMALSLCQMVILAKYKRRQDGRQIAKYINGEYIQNTINEGETQVDYSFLVITKSYFKYKFNYEFKEDMWLRYFNKSRKTNFDNLKDALLYELNYKIDKNQLDFIWSQLNEEE